MEGRGLQELEVRRGRGGLGSWRSSPTSGAAVILVRAAVVPFPEAAAAAARQHFL